MDAPQALRRIELRIESCRRQAHRLSSSMSRNSPPRTPGSTSEKLATLLEQKSKAEADARNVLQASSDAAYASISAMMSDMLPMELRDMIYSHILPGRVTVRHSESSGIFFQHPTDEKPFDLTNYKGLGEAIFCELVVRFYSTQQFEFIIPMDEDNIALFFASDTFNIQLSPTKLVSNISLSVSQRRFGTPGRRLLLDMAPPPIQLFQYKMSTGTFKTRFDFLNTLPAIESYRRVITLRIEDDVERSLRREGTSWLQRILDFNLPILEKLKTCGWKIRLLLQNHIVSPGRCVEFTKSTLDFTTKGCLEAAHECVEGAKH